MVTAPDDRPVATRWPGRERKARTGAGQRTAGRRRMRARAPENTKGRERALSCRYQTYTARGALPQGPPDAAQSLI